MGKAEAFDYSVELDLSAVNRFIIQLANSKTKMFDVILEKAKLQVHINQNQSGVTSFSKGFPFDITTPSKTSD